MANIKSSKKDSIVSKIRKLRNSSRRSMIKTFIKKVHYSIDEKNRSASLKAFQVFQSIIDRHVSKGLLHKNKAARYKSSLISKIKKLS